MEPFEVGSQFRLGTGGSGRVDSQGQLEQRVSAILEMVVRERFDAGQRFKNADNRRLSEPEQVLAIQKLREQPNDALLTSHFLNGA